MNDQRILEAALRQELAAFIQRSFHEVVPGSPFLPNWHIDAMAYELERVLAGDTRRLLITVPPRYLKSICASVAFPAWVLGHDPTRRIVAVSYADELASKHARDCRRVMESPWYRRVFPGTRLSRSKNTEGEYVTTEGGYRYSTSVGGALTGRGGNLIIIDDPLKPADALSDTRRQAVNDWYDNTLYSRIDNKVKDPIVLLMQRLHLEDVVGHVLEQERWVHLNLPAIAEEDQEIRVNDDLVYHRRAGDVLQPERESAESLAQTRQTLGSYAFSAQYQQQPIPVKGSILQWPWFKRYSEVRALGPEDLISQSWDPASVPGLNNDFSVCTTWLVRGEKLILLDVLRQQFDYPDLKRAVLAMAERWDTCEVIIEQANTGTALIQELAREQLLGHRILRWNPPRDDKVIRMAAHSPVIQAGRVYVPSQAPWLAEFRKEILQFPHGRYDDQIDSMSQFLYRMTKLKTHPFYRPDRPTPSSGRPPREEWPRPGVNFGW